MKAIVTEIDDTIIDTSSAPNILKREPLKTSREILKNFTDRGQIKIIYLSRRSEDMLEYTNRWLADNDFPKGEIYLWPGKKSPREFKRRRLKELSERYEIVCGIAGQEDDVDIYGSMRIPGILVEPNSDREWLKVERRINLILDMEESVKTRRKK